MKIQHNQKKIIFFHSYFALFICWGKFKVGEQFLIILKWWHSNLSKYISETHRFAWAGSWTGALKNRLVCPLAHITYRIVQTSDVFSYEEEDILYAILYSRGERAFIHWLRLEFRMGWLQSQHYCQRENSCLLKSQQEEPRPQPFWQEGK